MSILTPMFERDDHQGLGTPDFFSSTWNPDQNDLFFGDAYRSGFEDYGPYAPQLQQGRAENNHLDCFTNQVDGRLSSHATHQPGYQFGKTPSNDDLDRILAESQTSPVEESLTAVQLDTGFDLLFQDSRIHSLQNSDTSFIPNSSTPPTVERRRKAEAHLAPAKLVTVFGNGTKRNTSMRFGQITPVDSPPKDSSPATQKFPNMSKSRYKLEQSVEPEAIIKNKKPRKSKKKPLTSEQEEARRTKFLERNRVAADKCRQNRKKWMDDLQAKAHRLGADNSAKKAQVEELEQEVVQLKSLLLIHSRQCDESDVSEWVEEESNRVQTRSQFSSRLSIDDALSAISQGLEDVPPSMSRPSSSHGFRSVSDALSRRYSTASAGDEFFSVTSGESSRRPSAV